MASSFDHEGVRILLAASTQLYVSHALILPGCARHLIAHSLVHCWPGMPVRRAAAILTSAMPTREPAVGQKLLQALRSLPGTTLTTWLMQRRWSGIWGSTVVPVSLWGTLPL